MTKLELIGQIADLKDSHYKTALLLSGLIEVLTEKNLITPELLAKKTFLLDYADELEIARHSVETSNQH